MPDVFITLEEAAAFEGITYEAMKKRVQRSPEQHNVKSQAREGGGKDQVLISTSSLSAKARKAWRAVQKVEGSEVIIDKRAQEAVPWYVTADLNQYTEANKKRFYEAVELAARVQDFIDYDGPDRTGYAERYALGLGISPQSLYRYMKNVLEANAWALKLEKEDGKSRDYFRALALCRKPKETGTFPSLTDEQKAIIENIWFDKRFAANLGTIEMLYERFELEAERREWEEYPSIKTVARYIKFLMGQRGAESARFLAANGTREWKNKRMMKGKRDATSLQVMEYVVGDEHTFDFWVQWTAPNGKIKAVRPKLVAWLDMRSRAIIGDVACVNANSQTLKESLVKMIYSNPGGVPHILHVDNGKDYTAEVMTGQNRKQRKHRKIDLDFAFDSETVGFYQSIGIQEVGRSLPYQPWDKPIERFFSTVCSKFSKWFESYTGTLTGSKTYAKRQKDIDQMLERGELLTMEEFFEVWTEWKNTKYHTRKHRGLSDAGEKWVTPIEMFENGPRYRALAFTVSGYTKAQVLKKFYDELLAALEEGNSLAEFRENMNDFLEAEGYEGITPYQAENIFRTNIQTAYNVGHYKRMTEPGVKALRPYWQYDAVNDSKTRPSHLAMDGRVFMADDPIWDTWFPPNGFKCRCTVKTLSKRQMEQRGLTVETEAPRAARLEDGRFVNILPDPQFDTNPAKVRYRQ